MINVSTGRSFVSEVRFGPQVIERRFDDAFKLALMLKDVGIANRLADDQGLGVPVSALGEQLWRAAQRAMGEGACVLDVVRWYERATGVELKE